MSASLVIGVDVGTWSTKAVLVDASAGSVVAHASREHGLELGDDGAVEHDPERIWWGEVRDTLAELAEAVPARSAVAAVGLSSCGPCIVPVDESGNALRRGILYGIDTRATSQVTALATQWHDDVAISQFGMPFTSQSALPKIHWVEQNEPEVAARTRTWLTANGFAALRLTGERVLDHHQAAYFAPDGLGHLLPRRVWSAEVIGTMTAEAASLTGLRRGVPVVVGSSDGATDPVGAGGVSGDTALLRYGSTLGVTVLTSEGQGGVAGLWRTPGNRPGEVMLVGGLSTAGSVTAWFREQLARELPDGSAFAMLVAEASEAPIGSGGVLTLPYFAGERTPFSDPTARGVIAGLGLGTTRGELYRSVLEGAALGLRHLLESAREGGIAITGFRSVGGGTAGALWPQIVSDATGIPQEIVEPHVGAPLGAARLAAESAGLNAAGAPDWATVARRVHPDPAAAAVYDRLFPVFRDLHLSTRPAIGRLREAVS